MRTVILLLSVDESDYLRHSLPAAVAQEEADVLVIDNACTDATAEVAAEHGARVLRLERRLSYCEAINEGIDDAGDADSLLLLNADCFLAPGFLAAALPRLAEAGVGSVAPKLVRTRGPLPGERLDAIDAAGMVVDRRRKNTVVGHGRPALAFDTPGEAFGADGAAALYRRETLEACRIEGQVFDPDLVMWASDVDVAWRARLAGWRCAYEPRALAYHVRTYSPSTRARMPAEARRLQFRNRYLMMAKNDTPRDVLRDLPRIAAWELVAFGYALLRERALLGAYRDALRLLPAARRRGRAVRALRTSAAPFGLEPTP